MAWAVWTSPTPNQVVVLSCLKKKGAHSCPSLTPPAAGLHFFGLHVVPVLTAKVTVDTVAQGLANYFGHYRLSIAGRLLFYRSVNSPKVGGWTVRFDPRIPFSSFECGRRAGGGNGKCLRICWPLLLGPDTPPSGAGVSKKPDCRGTRPRKDFPLRHPPRTSPQPRRLIMFRGGINPLAPSVKNVEVRGRGV